MLRYVTLLELNLSNYQIHLGLRLQLWGYWNIDGTLIYFHRTMVDPDISSGGIRDRQL